jgi:hypothetical protein
MLTAVKKLHVTFLTVTVEAAAKLDFSSVVIDLAGSTQTTTVTWIKNNDQQSFVFDARHARNRHYTRTRFMRYDGGRTNIVVSRQWDVIKTAYCTHPPSSAAAAGSTSSVVLFTDAGSRLNLE